MNKTDLNMEALADWHVEQMDGDTLMDFAQLYLLDLYERDDEMFQDDWRWMEEHSEDKEKEEVSEEWDTQP